jgi:hypothetical protein
LQQIFRLNSFLIFLQKMKLYENSLGHRVTFPLCIRTQTHRHRNTDTDTDTDFMKTRNAGC